MYDLSALTFREISELNSELPDSRALQTQPTMPRALLSTQSSPEALREQLTDWAIYSERMTGNARATPGELPG